MVDASRLDPSLWFGQAAVLHRLSRSLSAASTPTACSHPPPSLLIKSLSACLYGFLVVGWIWSCCADSTRTFDATSTHWVGRPSEETSVTAVIIVYQVSREEGQGMCLMRILALIPWLTSSSVTGRNLAQRAVREDTQRSASSLLVRAMTIVRFNNRTRSASYEQRTRNSRRDFNKHDLLAQETTMTIVSRQIVRARGLRERRRHDNDASRRANASTTCTLELLALPTSSQT